MSSTAIKATKRNEHGKNQVKKLKAQNLTPGIIYGGDSEPVSITVDPRDLLKAYKANVQGRNTVLSVSIDENGKSTDERVVTYHLERNPITEVIEHVDFIRVTDDKKVKVEVKLIIEGVAPGVKMGGVFIKKKERIMLNCLPKDIPGPITIDISKMKIGDAIFIRDLQLSEDIEVLSFLDDTIVRVAAPRGKTIEEEEAEEAEDTEATADTDSDAEKDASGDE